MKRWNWVFVAPVVMFVAILFGNAFAQEGTGKPSKEEVMQKAQKLRMPFIANEGQVDGQVKFYAKTFGGTVYVTKDGGIVYLLPKHEADAKEDLNCRDRSIGLCYLPEQDTATASIFPFLNALYGHIIPGGREFRKKRREMILLCNKKPTIRNRRELH